MPNFSFWHIERINMAIYNLTHEFKKQSVLVVPAASYNDLDNEILESCQVNRRNNRWQPCWCIQIPIVWDGSESHKQQRPCHNSSLLPAGFQGQCQHLQWGAGYSGQAWIVGSAHGRLYLLLLYLSDLNGLDYYGL